MTQIFFLRRMPEGTRCRTYFWPLMMDRVAGVVAALRADDHVRLLGQHVNDLAFAFIAPLGADQNRIRHKFNKNPRT